MSKNRSNNSGSQVLIFAAVWAVLQLVRVSFFSTIPEILAGNAAIEWLYPSFIDVLIGVSAPLIAFLIWRKNGVWARLVALIWFAVSFLEHGETIVLNLISIKPHAFFGTTAAAITLELALFAVLDAIAFIIVWQQMLREHPLNVANTRMKSWTMVIFVVLWAFLQIPRYIAIPILQNIFSGGTDPAAWLLPALGDIVIATLAFVVIYAVWRKRGLWVWAFTLLWLFLSIYDHMSTVTAAFTTPGPQIFGGGTTPKPSNGAFPGIQAIIDAVLFIYVAREKVRLMFVENPRSTPK